MAIRITLQNFQPELRVLVKGLYEISQLMTNSNNSNVIILSNFENATQIPREKILIKLDNIKGYDKETRKWLKITRDMFADLLSGSVVEYYDFKNKINTINFALIKDKRLRQLIYELKYLFGWQGWNNPVSQVNNVNYDSVNKILSGSIAIKWINDYNYNRTNKVIDGYNFYDNVVNVGVSATKTITEFSDLKDRNKDSISFRVNNFQTGDSFQLLSRYLSTNYILYSYSL